METFSEPGVETEMTTSGPTATSRRQLMRATAKLALIAPVALAALPPGIAFADDQDNDNEDADHPGNFPPGRGLGRGNAFGRGAGPFARSGLMLVSVTSVNGGTAGADFGASSPGSDGLSFGAVAINPGNHQAWVSLRGAAANSGYNVQFEHLQDHAREDLGTVTTDGNGNFTGLTPNALGGNNRVGCFVLARNISSTNQDEYVTVWA